MKRVSASQLASACVCEQQTMFDIERGLQRTPEQMERIEDGIDAHQRLHASARMAYSNVETSVEDRRCFVATHLFGPDAVETKILRNWRDTELMKTALGRVTVNFYYQWSPAMVKAMDRSALLQFASKWCAQKLVVAIARKRQQQ